MLGEILGILEIIDRISEWISRILKERGATEETTDAQLLAETGKLLASLRALDNAIHSLVGQLTLFDLDWSLTKRNELITQINGFAHRETIITIIRQTLRELEELFARAKEEDWNLAMAIFGCGADLMRTMSDSSVTPFRDTDALREFAMRIKRAQTHEDVEAVIEKSKEVLNVLNRQQLGAADQTFGKLRGQILARHPKLLPPHWTL